LVNVRTIAAFFGVLGVGFGAGSAHLMSGASPDAHEWCKTGTVYWLVHTAAMLGSGRSDGRATSSTWLFAAGIALFSGSLYMLALMPDVKWLAHVTPVGGFTLMAGWLQLVRRKD
jgi:uncharacterized membrane protein YgdD (TMEM256/DUF423 family)